jgi:predicted methyltransferase
MPRTSLLTTAILVALLAACSAVDADEAARIVDVLGVEQGMSVADVGAGDGEWSLVLSDAVGADGTVYATEVEDDLVAELGELGLDNFRGNIVAVLGGERSTGLEPGCCDAILLRMVYHHFTEPRPMRASLLAALRPGGRIAVIDITPQQGWAELDGVPDRGGHGIAIEDLVAEMLGAGFELEEIHQDWRSGDEDRFCVVFRKPARAPAS